MSAPINIQLDQQIFPRNFVAHFPQSSPSRTGPERRELLLAQFNLAFFAMAAPTDLKCQRRSLVCFSKPYLSACGFRGQITLLDNEAPRPLEVIRQPFDQKFSLNFAIVSRSMISSHKRNIVNVMRSVSRLSRRVSGGGVNSKRHCNTQLKQGVNQRRLSRKKLGDRHQSLQARACVLHRVQPGAVWRNSCSAPAAANSGHADIATIMAKKSASMANSMAFSPAR